MPEVVEWLGLSAVYSADELLLMGSLKAGVSAGTADLREIEVVHELKALLGARLVDRVSIHDTGWATDGLRTDESPPQRWPHGGLVEGQGSLLTV